MKDKAAKSKAGKSSKKQKFLDKKAKLKQREENLKTIKEHRLDEKLAEVLESSQNIGGKKTIKDHLIQEIKKEKLGLKTDDDLYTPNNIKSLNQNLVFVGKIPIYKPNLNPLEDPEESQDPIPVALKVPKTIVKPFLKPEPQKLEEPEEQTEFYNPTPIPELNPMTLMGYTDPVPKTQNLDSQPPDNTLPITHLEQEIIETIREHPITIICGETGSGKSTQLPKFLLENGFAHKGRIGITQPRRIAAVTLAQRVSQETNLELGTEIGYQIRYDASSMSQGNKIKFMTDGILLKEVASDFLLLDYSVLIIDEAHERSVNTDILLGLVSRIVRLREKKTLEINREPLKVVIMSATLRVGDFTENFELFETPPPVVKIDTRQYPVAVHFAKSTKSEDFMDLALEKTIKIHKNLPPGGILIFLPGKKDVITLRTLLKQKTQPGTCRILPLYSMMPVKKQLKIFSADPADTRRLIVIATNVAETSITIPNIVYVVDTGLEKRKLYSSRLQMSKFSIQHISKASANQRSGRAGRTCPGHCYRLYSNAAYSNAFTEFREPDICTTPIALIVLQLKALGIQNIFKFPFPTKPETSSLTEALSHLAEIGALSQNKKGQGDIYCITELGREISDLPIAPRYGKMLITAKKFGVHRWMSIIVAGMEVQQIFENSVEGSAKIALAESKKLHSHWFKGHSDFLSYLRLFKDSLSAEDLGKFCEEAQVVEKSLKEMQMLSIQLLDIVEGEKNHTLDSLVLSLPGRHEEISILKSITSGLIDQIAIKVQLSNSTKPSKRVPYYIQKHIDTSMYSEDYKDSTSNMEFVYIHPSSYFFSRSPPDIIAYQHLAFITRPTLLGITEVRSEWLYELGGQMVQNVQVHEGSEGFYDEKTDTLKTWATAAYGQKLWPLPPCFIEFPDCDAKYFAFTKGFLEGKILPATGFTSQTWRVKPTKLSNKNIIKLQKVFKKHKISSSKSLIQKVIQETSFIIENLKALAKEETGQIIDCIWKTAGIV